jgi:YjbE family integral membrane protein
VDTFVAILNIIFADILLSGDNAVVIALACRDLPPRYMKRAMIFGVAAAIGLRVVFVFLVNLLFGIPGLKLAGAALLLWIAFKLVLQHEEEEAEVKSGRSLWAAIRIIVIADAVMSLDNVIAITAAAKGETWLVVFGLLLSMPLILFASTLVLRLLKRFPFLVVLGGALLGYIAGEIAITDALVQPYLDSFKPYPGIIGRIAGGAIVLAVSLWILARRRRGVEAAPADVEGAASAASPSDVDPDPSHQTSHEVERPPLG